MFASEYVEAVLLGILQGIAEFLPISSSGHLVIASEIIESMTGREYDAERNLEMNVVLHLGTLISILWVCRHEILIMLKSRKLIFAVILATVPLVFIAVTPLKDLVEKLFGNPVVVGFSLLVTALLLLFGQKQKEGTTELESISWKQALFTGVIQSFAIIPGISRSGSTISAGLVCGMKREVAATFSFLIAIPAISGAAILELKDIFSSQGSQNPVPVLLVGGIVACVVGIISLKLLFKIVNQKKLHWFAGYCFAVGVSVLVWQFCF
jgi:undecaprenyl-diphosphatase